MQPAEKFEVHHRIPRFLLSARDRACGPGPGPLDGAGIQAWMDFEDLCLRHGFPQAADLSREELAEAIEASTVELPYNEHRRVAHTTADWRAWGSQGGRTTLARYGRAWFRALAARRWGRMSARELNRMGHAVRFASGRGTQA